MGKKVAIFGGGMAGLAAAHELLHRDYDVTVYEAHSDFGGKSASQTLGVGAPPTVAPRTPLLGEHGFRFFPGFYRHVIATMREIPLPSVGGAKRFVADNLRPSLNAGIAYRGTPLQKFPRRIDLPAWDMAGKAVGLYGKLGFDPEDLARMAWFRLKYMSSGPLRRTYEYDAISWWTFIDGDSPLYTDKFRQFEKSIPRTMSAMVATTSSAKVIGDITVQMMLGYVRPDEQPDRVLVGPTTRTWIDHWRTYLDPNGTRLLSKQRLTKLRYDKNNKEISGADVLDQASNTTSQVTADHYLVALPIEQMRALIDANMANDDEQLAALRGISDVDFEQWQGWMSGAQFYLKNDELMVDGHVFYPESQWALTSVSQGQFWAQSPEGSIEKRFGDGSVKGILSVDISDWDNPSPARPWGPPRSAKQCSNPGEVLKEVLAQLRDALDNPGFLADGNIAYSRLDSNLVFPTNPGDPPLYNTSPLLIHPVGGLALRPEAHNKIGKLFLASDYVRTKTELATMEGANEAARMAVNAILDRDDSPHVRCALYDLQEEPFFAVLKAIDDERYKQGRGHLMDDAPVKLLLGAPDLLSFAQDLVKSSADVLAGL